MRIPSDKWGVSAYPPGSLIRLFRPKMGHIFLEVRGEVVEVEQETDEEFVFHSRHPLNPTDYRVYHPGGYLAHDPYAFGKSLSFEDLQLFSEGKHPKLYEILGAHPFVQEKIRGIRFAVWAPHAKLVCLMGAFNGWNPLLHPMYLHETFGVWELFVPGLHEFETYKFAITTPNGQVVYKIDPMAFFSELRPKHASRVFSMNRYVWKDQSWIEKRQKTQLNCPMMIYEVHLPSWKSRDGGYENYRTLSYQIAKHCKKLHCTHVELMPIMEHPLDDSWGYQVTGFFNPTSRLGNPEEFQYFVDYLHQQDIGVILDWTPAHFPKDPHALAKFDGKALYETPAVVEHPFWRTAVFDYKNPQVVNFLIASALFWIEKMHIDGIRVDAVSSILFADYGKKPATVVRVEGVAFCQQLTKTIHNKYPGVLLIAEEEMTFKKVTDSEGLGFDLQWNMGWAHDTRKYFQIPFDQRKDYYQLLTFSLMYAFSSKLILTLSHDEVSFRQRTLFHQMVGTHEQKAAGVRAFLSYLICHPGKKLLFMGQEWGSCHDWKVKEGLYWEGSLQSKTFRMMEDLIRIYRENDPFWIDDFSWGGFEWIDCASPEKGVLAYFRHGSKKSLVMVHNFSCDMHPSYRLPLVKRLSLRQIFSSNDLKYGGSESKNETISYDTGDCFLKLFPLTTYIFEIL